MLCSLLRAAVFDPNRSNSHPLGFSLRCHSMTATLLLCRALPLLLQLCTGTALSESPDAFIGSLSENGSEPIARRRQEVGNTTTEYVCHHHFNYKGYAQHDGLTVEVTRAANLVKCQQLCSSSSSSRHCGALVYNKYSQCTLKRVPWGPAGSLRPDDRKHGTVSCIRSEHDVLIEDPTSRTALRAQGLQAIVESLPDTGNGSLVIIGAHLLGEDENDPLYRATRNVPWRHVLVVEASPLFSAKLRARLDSGPPPYPSARGASVLNIGCCPAERASASLSFHSLNASAKGLPFWSTQIGSFDHDHVHKHFGALLQQQSPASGWTSEKLSAAVQVEEVPCLPLPKLLRGTPPPQVMLVDTEGFDCAIVAAISARVLRTLQLIVYEHKHCTDASRAAARARLKAGGLEDATHWLDASPSGPGSENVVYARRARASLCLVTGHDPGLKECRTSLRRRANSVVPVMPPNLSNARATIQTTGCSNIGVACAQHNVSLIVATAPDTFVSAAGRASGAAEQHNYALRRAAFTLQSSCASLQQPSMLSRLCGLDAVDQAAAARARLPKRLAGELSGPRAPNWCKVAELIDALSTLGSECDVVGYVDADVILPATPPLLMQPPIRQFLADPSKLLFASREPSGLHWGRGSGKDFHGWNNLNNTLLNTGFLLVKRSDAALRLLRRWWCATVTLATGEIGEPLALYHRAFPFEQRILDHLLRTDRTVRQQVMISASVDHYNSHKGKLAKHIWFKRHFNVQTFVRGRGVELAEFPCVRDHSSRIAEAPAVPEVPSAALYGLEVAKSASRRASRKSASQKVESWTDWSKHYRM